MTPWQIALIELIAKVGLDAALSIASGVQKSTTIDEAIAALRETQKKTWEDYKREAAEEAAKV